MNTMEQEKQVENIPLNKVTKTPTKYINPNQVASGKKLAELNKRKKKV